MYYEEKIINGRLCFRTKPDGDWQPLMAAHAAVVNALLALKEEQRMAVFALFCTHCGKADTGCRCGDDE